MSSYSSQLHEEQQAVNRCYDRLDTLRAQARKRLDGVRATGSHGSPTQRTERDSFAALYEDRLLQLRAVEDRLVFGRLDDSEAQRRYIGRIGMSSEDHEPMLTDWRAEAARPFYEATPSRHGDIVMRRHITLHFRTVVGVEDEILDINSDEVDRASSSGTLTGEGALLASLTSRRTGKMTDIVATIQAEQDRIIRSPLDRVIVVQGGPGTGKTAVALHRAAYLLYTHRTVLERSGVLVVGPSTAFLHYIDQVLPSLGETGVVSRTIADLIPGINATASDAPHAAALKGDRRMAQTIATAISARIRIPRGLPIINVGGVPVPMLAADLEEAQTEARRTRQPHNKARETFVHSMIRLMRDRYVDRLDYTPNQSELSSVVSQLRMNDQVRVMLNLAWLPMTGRWLIDQLFSKPGQLRRFAPWLGDEDVEALTRPKHAPVTKSDVALLDEALELLGPDPKSSSMQEAADAKRAEDEQFAQETLAQPGIGSGIISSRLLAQQMNGVDDELLAQRAGSEREWVYGHIVVDEAQELTPMEWRMLLRRCPSRSFTIVGDVAQTAAMGGTRAWHRTLDPLFGEQGWDLNELTINYRNPQEVSELASHFAAREGLYISTVNSVRTIPDSVQRITVAESSRLHATVAERTVELAQRFTSRDGTGRVAIIAPAGRIDDLRRQIRRTISASIDPAELSRLQRQDPWERQIAVCDTEMVKGLEYDAVIVVNPGEIEQHAPSRQVAASDLYVAMTRPTQRLLIVRTLEDEHNLNI